MPRLSISWFCMGWSAALASTDIESMSRFFQAIVQSIGIQSRDGATQAELEGMVETAMTLWPPMRG